MPSFGIGMKTDLFQSCGHCCVFQICWTIECSTFAASSFRIWNSSTGIPSPPLAFFVVMLPKAHLLHIPGCLALGEWSHHHDYLGCEDLFCTVLLCILATSVLLCLNFLPKQKYKSVSFTTKQIWNMLSHLSYSHSSQKTLRELALEHAKMMTLCPHTSAGWKEFWKLFAK